MSRTPLHDAHLAARARLVDFAGWEMPLHYGSQIDEHHAVRRDAGAFDVSHMLALEVEGEGAHAFLRRVLANDVARLSRQATASRDAALAHLAAGKARRDGWFKTASELKRRMERDYTELNIPLKTLNTLMSGMPESVKRAGPLFGDKALVSASEFNAAAAQVQDELKRVQLELERARQLPIN